MRNGRIQNKMNTPWMIFVYPDVTFYRSHSTGLYHIIEYGAVAIFLLRMYNVHDVHPDSTAS